MVLLRRPSPGSAAESRTDGPFVVAERLGVKYPVGTKRDDLQSLVYRALLRRESRKEIWALRDVGFSAQAGDIVGVIGRNGAGKSTLCKVISGILRPDTGTIRVHGEVFSLLSVGTGFNQELSGRENILLNGMMLGLSRREVEDLLPEIVEFAGLERFIDQPLKRYSSGMRARLGFSIAAMARPQILILDETLSVGDAEFNRKAAAKMQELVQRAGLVIVVTHQVDFVAQHCNKAIWLEEGRIRLSGDSREVVAAYKAALPAIPPRVTRVIHLVEPRAQADKQEQEIVTVTGLSIRFNLDKKHRQENGRPLLGDLFRRGEPFWALRDVSFRVHHGDILGIIGRNGAGKTTLCRVLSGILKPDEGQVVVRGETTALLTLGAGFNIQLTGMDNIFLNGMMLGIPKKRIAALTDEIVSFAELEKYIDQPVKQYSSGMRSRLAFSIAATLQPDLLIVDEALAVGDLAFYVKASAKMQELMARAKAVVVVTHDMSFVQKVCTRALWLENGSVKRDGDPKEVVAEYLASLKR